jgi:hypothetical protein
MPCDKAELGGAAIQEVQEWGDFCGGRGIRLLLRPARPHSLLKPASLFVGFMAK